MLRSALLAAARSPRVRRFVETAPPTRPLVRRFVAGTDAAEALSTARELRDQGMRVSLDHLGEHVTSAEQAGSAVSAYREVLAGLAAEGLAGGAEVSVKLSALGQALPVDGEKIALEHARRICTAAEQAGSAVTLDMEDHTTTDSTLRVLAALRVDFPSTGAVLQAQLRRTEGDCRDLARQGSRVRLCKGAYAAPASAAFTRPSDVDRSFARCLGVLMAGSGYPMVASHDPRVVRLAGQLAARNGRGATEYEHQMLYGVRPEEQRRLADEGYRIRVYIPYGQEWYGYFVRRLAERPANVGFFLRSLASRG